jgi:hypothetical protein
MKTPQNLQGPSSNRNTASTPAWMAITAILAGAFWFATTPAGMAGPSATPPPNDCTICHKRMQTLVVPCNSLEYQRHRDHGDTDGACEATGGSRPDDGRKIDSGRPGK